MQIPKNYDWLLDARENMYQNKLIVEMVRDHFTVSNELGAYEFINILNSLEEGVRDGTD